MNVRHHREEREQRRVIFMANVKFEHIYKRFNKRHG